ncbi:hypothetical protein ACFOWA_14235 [Pedobacter lithocola]|uniref:Uncharacterized protein n=1 Tax=Pedobacter lithocola TaxID=1908239 RepID=A0ABV8PE26_9SPHI
MKKLKWIEFSIAMIALLLLIFLLFNILSFKEEPRQRSLNGYPM